MARAVRRILQSPFGWLILIILILEAFAAIKVPYARQPKASTVYRNPTPHRGWPEYIKGQKGPHRKLVIIISNSQGIGWESARPESLYTAELEKEFALLNIPVEIENWSNGGITTPDIELLSFKAIQRKPDLLLFILGYNNFDFPPQLYLDYSPSDINLLAGEPSFWPYLKDTTFFKNTTFDDIMRRFLLIHSALARSRIALYDALAEHIPLEYHKYIFGHSREPLIRLDEALERRPRSRPLPPPKHILELANLALPALPVENMRQRLETFNIFYPMLNKRLSKNHIPFIWVWMPVASEVFPRESKRVMRVFEIETGKLIHNSTAKYIDLTYALPGKYFYMLNHLDEDGHKALSKILLPIIKDGLQ